MARAPPPPPGPPPSGSRPKRRAGIWVRTPAPSPELSLAAAPRCATRDSAWRARPITSCERSPDARATNPTPHASCSRHGSRSGARRLAQRDRSDSGIAAPFRVSSQKKGPLGGERAGASSQSSTRLRRPFAPVWGSNRLQDRDGGRRAIVHEFGPPKGINRKVLIIHLLE